MTQLPTRRLGAEGPEITRVGFGAWAIGGGGWAFGWGPQDDRASIRTMRHAIDQGVNWIDTAAVYGLGHSERIVGQLLRELPWAERPYVFTKCGLIWDPATPMVPARRVLEPTSIRRECEDSLQRLGVDRIDLYQFHWPDEVGTPVEDSWGEMMRLVEEGKVRWAGVSNFDVELLERCERVGHVQSVQPPFSLIRRGFAGSVLPWCVEHGTGVIGYSPLQSGIFTEKWSIERVNQLPEDDWRKGSREFQSPNVERNLGLRDALVPIAQRHATTLSAVAVAWPMAWQGVTGAIVGARTPEQVDGWLDAARLDLTEQDLEDIEQAIQRTGAGTGPARPAWAPARSSRAPGG